METLDLERIVERAVERGIEKALERRPRPPHVNMTQAAKMLDLSLPTVRKLVHSGKLRFDKCGLIPITQVDALLESDSA